MAALNVPQLTGSTPGLLKDGMLGEFGMGQAWQSTRGTLYRVEDIVRPKPAPYLTVRRLDMAGRGNGTVYRKTFPAKARLRRADGIGRVQERLLDATQGWQRVIA